MTDRPPLSPASVLRRLLLSLLGLSVLAVEWLVLFSIAWSQVNHEYQQHGIIDGGGYDGDMQAVTRGTIWWLLLLLAQILLALTLVVVRTVHRRRSSHTQSRR